MKLTFDVHIAAPQARAFGWAAEAEKLAQWMPDLEHTEYQNKVSIDPANPVGLRFRQHMRAGKRVLVYEGKIIEYLKPSLLVVELDGPQFEMRLSYQFRATAAGRCALYATVELRFKSLSLRLWGLLFRGGVRKRFRNQLECLRQLAEQEAQAE